jgi:hypothetical protein
MLVNFKTSHFSMSFHHCFTTKVQEYDKKYELIYDSYSGKVKKTL